jgi:hypothetical protein
MPDILGSLLSAASLDRALPTDSREVGGASTARSAI